MRFHLHKWEKVSEERVPELPKLPTAEWYKDKSWKVIAGIAVIQVALIWMPHSTKTTYRCTKCPKERVNFRHFGI